MGRKKSVHVFKLFQPLPNISGIERSRYRCNYCGWRTCHNSTRMKIHILQCKICPRSVKQTVVDTKPTPTTLINNNVATRPRRHSISNTDDEGDLELADENIANCSNFDANATAPCGLMNDGVPRSRPRPKRTSSSFLRDVEHCAPSMPRPRLISQVQGVYSEQTRFDSSRNPCAASMHSFTDSIEEQDKQEAYNMLLCRAIYGSGAPLHIVENQYWRELFEKLMPGWKMPLREDVTNVYLETEYATLLQSVNTQVSEAVSLGIMCDGWSNTRKHSFINIILATPAPVFYRTFSTNTESLDASYIFECISKVLGEVDPQKVFGIVTDHSPNMQAAWSLLRKKHTHVYPYGCVVDGLSLLAQDIIMLPVVSDTLNAGKEIVGEIVHSQKLNAILAEKQVDCKKNILLELPVATRWGSQATFVDSFLTNRDILLAVAIDERANIIDGLESSNKKPLFSAESKQRLLDDVFWNSITGIHNLLQPILKWIKIMKSEKSQISFVCEIFDNLKKSFTQTFQNFHVQQFEEEEIFSKLQQRTDLCITDLHKAANLLDPLQRGIGLMPSEVIDAIEFIDAVSSGSPEVDDTTVLSEFAQYRAKDGVWGRDYIWQAAENVSADIWWKGISPSRHLSKIACKILNSPPTSAACERVSNTFDHIQDKRQDYLPKDRAVKMAFIKHNLRLYEGTNLVQTNTSVTNAQTPIEEEIIPDLEMTNTIIEIYEDSGAVEAGEQNTVQYEDEEWLMDEEIKDNECMDQESLLHEYDE